MKDRVSGCQACLGVTFRLEDRPDLVLEFVVDTGFAGHLTLPQSAVEASQLPFLLEITANLVDDSVIADPAYTSKVAVRPDGD